MTPVTDLLAPPQADQILIFANPIAGRGVGTRIADELESQFRRQGLHVHKWLQRPSDLSDDELRGPARAAIVIGGDGTLRGVAERLLRLGHVPPLLPVPLGTANLMGRHLGIQWKLATVTQQVSRMVNDGRVRSLDVGRANDRLFLLMAGVGFDAKVVMHLDRLRRGPIQLWHYVLPTVLSLLDAPGAPMNVVMDGQEVFAEQRALAFVGNLAEYGTGFPILPFAQGDDGLLDLCVLPCESHVDLARLFLLAAAGEHVQSEGVVYRRGKRIRIESPEPVPVQVDGDPAGFTPVNIDLLPVQLPFIVP